MSRSLRINPEQLCNSKRNIESLSDPNFVCQIKDTAEGPAELLILDPIGADWFGEGVTAKSVSSFLEDNKDRPINVRINSPGGLVFDGITIHNQLLEHNAPVNVFIEGLAASAAALISQAGTTVNMMENATFMIHRALSVAIGNTDDMLDMADWLTVIDKGLSASFAAKTGLTPDKIMDLMTGKVDGTVMDAEMALEFGFIDNIISLKRDDDVTPVEDTENNEKIRKAVSAYKARAYKVSAGRFDISGKIKSLLPLDKSK